MAQAALKTVWLEPEEQVESKTPRLRPRRRRNAAPAIWQRNVIALVTFGLIVGVGMTYIGCNARIARQVYRQQALRQQLAQEHRRAIELNLELDRLTSQPRLVQVAQAQGLEMPSADRIHYMQAGNDLPRSMMARTTPVSPAQHSWFARSSHQLVATMDNAFQRLSRGPGEPAYAQD